jgi:hypothetical protein
LGGGYATSGISATTRAIRLGGGGVDVRGMKRTPKANTSFAFVMIAPSTQFLHYIKFFNYL